MINGGYFMGFLDFLDEHGKGVKKIINQKKK